LQIGEDESELSEGDAIYFESGAPHGYRKVGPRRTTALVVVTT
jgi:quercetin dioxygenase-like cupin family protein